MTPAEIRTKRDTAERELIVCLGRKPGVALTNFTVLSEEQTLSISLPSLSDVEFSEGIRELQTLKS